jgi:hypothetical protein
VKKMFSWIKIVIQEIIIKCLLSLQCPYSFTNVHMQRKNVCLVQNKYSRGLKLFHEVKKWSWCFNRNNINMFDELTSRENGWGKNRKWINYHPKHGRLDVSSMSTPSNFYFYVNIKNLWTFLSIKTFWKKSWIG